VIVNRLGDRGDVLLDGEMFVKADNLTVRQAADVASIHNAVVAPAAVKLKNVLRAQLRTEFIGTFRS